MAIQRGPVPFTGKLGTVVGYRGKNGQYYLKLAPDPPLYPKKPDPTSRGTRTKTEFGRAVTFAASIRNSVKAITRNSRDGGLCNRLNKTVYALLRDQPGPLGSRLVSGIDPSQLEGVQWNEQFHLTDRLLADYSGFIDPLTGKMHLLIASFNSLEHIIAPPDATHCCIFATGMQVNPEKRECTSATRLTDRLPLLFGKMPAIELNIDVSPLSGHFLFLGLGIRFYARRRGIDKELPEGAFELVKACKTAVD